MTRHTYREPAAGQCHRPQLKDANRVRPLRHPALLLLLAATLLGGCARGFLSYPPQVRGNRVDPDRLEELVNGVSTKADVTALLGSPTARATFDSNTWLYISEVTKPQIAGTQRLLDQQVVAVNFDDSGVLKSVERRSEVDSRPVQFVARTTPSPGTETNFLQQLFGNIGRFGPSGGTGIAGTTSGNY
jgi:outer membrane protein assembly factor BamE (lipoprotein component of BamABCDE complex)